MWLLFSWVPFILLDTSLGVIAVADSVLYARRKDVAGGMQAKAWVLLKRHHRKTVEDVRAVRRDQRSMQPARRQAQVRCFEVVPGNCAQARVRLS